MGEGDLSSAGGTGGGNMTIRAMKEVGLDTRIELYAEKIVTNEVMADWVPSTNPFAKKMRGTGKSMRSQLKRVSEALRKGEKAERLELLKQMKKEADEFEKRNPELKAKILLLLREQIKPGSTKEEILKKLQDFYPDVSLADEVLDFLLETSEGELHRSMLEAKNELNDAYKREIAAGRNMGQISRETEGLGTPTTLRDLYRDITGTSRDVTTLFDELSKKYQFKELKNVFKFLFHSLGSDMKAKGPSIPRGQLHMLMQETRTLQAILGVYRFFAGRMRLVNRLFAKEGLQVPQRLNFETLSKQFMGLCSERYPSAEKIMKTALALGIDKLTIAKIIIYSQMRDAIREVSMNQIFRSLQHRDDLFDAIIEALEDLEDEWEEQQDQEKEEDEEDWEVEEE